MQNKKNKPNICNVVKIIRLYNNITLAEMSDKTGITQSRISKIERGIESVSEETLRKIEKGISFKIERNNESKNFIDSIYFEFLNRLFDDDDYVLFYENLSIDYLKLMMSNDFYKILLCEFIISINKGNNKYCDDLERTLIQLNLDSLSAQIFSHYQAYYQYTLGNIDIAIQKYKETLTINYNPKTHAMIHYHLALAFKDKNQLIDMYKSINLSKGYFIEHVAFRRMLYCDMNLATVYSRLGAVDEALNIYEQCIKLMTNLNCSIHLKATAYRNIAWIHIQNKNYLKAIETLKIAEQIKANNQLAILYNIWCYYMIGNHKMTDMWISRGDKIIKDYPLEFVLLKNLYKSKNCPNSLKRLINDCQILLESLSKIPDYELIDFYEDILIELHVKNNDYKTAFLLLKEQKNRNKIQKMSTFFLKNRI